MIDHSKGACLRHTLSGHEYIAFYHVLSCVDRAVDGPIISDIGDLDNFSIPGRSTIRKVKDRMN